MDDGGGPLTEEFGDGPDILQTMSDVTVSELVQMYGEEATRRGIQYIASLSDADTRYRDVESPDEYIEGMTDGFQVDDDNIPDEMEKASDKWAQKMKRSGLGLE